MIPRPVVAFDVDGALNPGAPSYLEPATADPPTTAVGPTADEWDLVDEFAARFT